MRVDGDWLRSAECQSVFAMLLEGGFDAYAVGGAVRDAALGMPVADVDIATNATPDQVAALAADYGLSVVPTGLAHGTMTVVANHVAFEVTTYRRDVATDGRRATVAFADDAATDAARRDFTMNALYADRDGTVLDPLGGWPDLQARRVRFIGDAHGRIREDALRILRFFRFHAWYAGDGGIDPDGLAACAELADLLDMLSAERVGHEMRRLLAAPDPALALAAMAASGVMARVAPGANAGLIAPLVSVEAGCAPDWMRRGRAMGPVADWRWRFSRAEVRAMHQMDAALEAEEPVPVLAYRFGPDAARNAVLIRAATLGSPVPDALETEINFGATRQFPLRAADLGDRIAPGPALGKALKRLEEMWVSSGFSLTREQLLATRLSM